jgi:hypothetical protein
MAAKGPTGWQILAASAFAAAVGTLIGFGTQGTLRAACLGAGVGAIAPVVVLALAARGGPFDD